MLTKNYRVIDRNGFEQHAVGVFDRSRCHHHQTGIVRVDGLHALAVKGAAARSAARGQPNGNRARHLCSPIKGGGLIDDLVEADRGKVRELHFYNRSHSFDRRADGQADYRILTDRRIDHPSRKLLRQIFCRLERAAERANVLSVDEYARVFGQRPRLRLANGLQVSDAHARLNLVVPGALPPGVATTRRASLRCRDRVPARAAQ